MTIRIIRREMKKRRKEGQSYAVIAQHFGVTKPEVGRIIKGGYPSPSIAVKLGIPAKCNTCKRRLKAKAQKQTQPQPEHVQWWRTLPPEQRNNIIKTLHRAAGAF